MTTNITSAHLYSEVSVPDVASVECFIVSLKDTTIFTFLHYLEQVRDEY